MKITVFLVAIFCFTVLFCKAQQDKKCKCQYYSKFDFEEYKHKIDSISLILKEKYNNPNMLISGLRGFSVATVIFIINANGRKKAFFYDLFNGINHTVDDDLLKVSDKIVSDSLQIKALSEKILQPNEYEDPDISFFFCYNPYFSANFFEICDSVVSSVRNDTIGVELRHFLNTWVTPPISR